MPKWGDVRDVTPESTGISYPTLISGGFPCQPFSCAGKQKGKSDDRYLWPEFLRVIRELQPVWVMGENVPGITKIALDDIIDSLEAERYSTRTYSYPASLVGACHKRERIFIVAYCNNTRSGTPRINTNSNRQEINQGWEGQPFDRINGQDCVAPNPYGTGLQRGNGCPGGTGEPKVCTRLRDADKWYEVATRFCRVDDGISHRVHRLKALGNSVVPQQVYPILKAIAEIERGMI